MTPDSADKQHKEQSIHNFIDSHLKELQWTAYGLAAVGAAIVLSRLKATTKFRHVSSIPAHFTTKNYRLQGQVKQVAESGDLMVDHIPIIHLSLSAPSHKLGKDVDEGLLCVRAAGVTLTPKGVTWLWETTQGRHVWFKLLQVKGPAIECDITIRKSWMRRRLSLSEELVRQGLCPVKEFPAPPASPAYDTLVTRLLSLEHAAQGKGRGLWKEEKYQDRSWVGRGVVSRSVRWIKHRLKSLFGRKP